MPNDRRERSRRSPSLLSAADIAADWSVSTRTALRWMHEGRFGPLYGAGKIIRVAVEGYERGKHEMRRDSGAGPGKRSKTSPSPRPLERQRGVLRPPTS